MRTQVIISSAVLIGMLTGTPTAAQPDTALLVDHTEWAYRGDLPSLRVYLTPVGRAVAGRLDGGGQGDTAWREVLAGAPDADTPGMREQFLCHWQYAEFAEPGKASWNLEPWRPVVDEATMLESGCNPGGREESF